MTFTRAEYDRVCAERDAVQVTCERLETHIDEQRAAIEDVAHKLNNMLAAVLGSVDMVLRELPAGSSSRTRVERIQSAALTSADLVTQLQRGQFAP